MSRWRVGTAGWSIPGASATLAPGDGTHLNRYAGVLDCAEINTSFHRSHRARTYAKWAALTPPDFRFSVKVPRAITHEQRLRASRVPLQTFLSELSGLGDRLGVILVQLPPSLAFEPRPVRTFFSVLAALHAGAVVCEPRHVSWFTPSADRLLRTLRVGRAAADPALCPAAALPGGWLGPAEDGANAVVYYRWHGSPRRYVSDYADEWLRSRVSEMRAWPEAAEVWCIFDNTAAGHALPNAIRMRTHVGAPVAHRR